MEKDSLITQTFNASLGQELHKKHFGERSSIFFSYQEERKITLHWDEMQNETARTIVDSDAINHQWMGHLEEPLGRVDDKYTGLFCSLQKIIASSQFLHT